MTRIISLWFCLLAAMLSGVAGCAANPEKTALSEDLSHAQPDHWMNQPASVRVTAGDYLALWNAAAEAARYSFFELDRQDYRSGVMTTRPAISAQFFELWRGDAATAEDRAQSALASVRRTVRFEIVPLEQGGFELTPKVLLEREALAERRVSTVIRPSAAFGSRSAWGTSETDQGKELPDHYWYAIGRDAALERQLAERIQRRLNTAQIAYR